MKTYADKELDYILKFLLGMLGEKHKLEVLECIVSKYDYISPQTLLLIAEDTYYKINQLKMQQENVHKGKPESLLFEPKESLWTKLKIYFSKARTSPQNAL